MKSLYKRYFLTTIGYFAGNVFTKLISFILLPLYTKLINPEIYGIYGVNMTIVQLVVPIVYLSIWDAMFRFAVDEETVGSKYRIISNGLVVVWISSIVCAGVLLVINVFWNLHNPYLVCIYAVMNGFQYFYGCISRSMHDNKVFIISGCVNSLINLSLNWIGIAHFHHGIEVLYYSYIIGTAVQILIIEIKFRVLGHFRWSYAKKQVLNMLMRFGGPLALNSAMQWLLTGLTQVMIAYKLGTYYNGLFSVAIKFATVISLIVSVFQFAWYELAYELARDKNSASYYKRTVNMLFGILVLASAGLILMIKIVYPFFVAEAYWDSLEIIPHIVIYACATAYAGFLGTIYMAYKDVNILTVSSLVSGGVNSILLLTLIPYLGFHGALMSLTVSSILMMIFRSVVLHKKYSINLTLGTVLYIVPLPCCCFIFYATDFLGYEIGAVVICVILLLFATHGLYGVYLAVGVRRLKGAVSRIVSFFLVVFGGRPKYARFANIEESINILSDSTKSLIRFGDGEFSIMNNHGIHYQDADKNLAEELKSIVEEYNAADSRYYLAMPAKCFSCSWVLYLRHWRKMKYFLYSRRVFIKNYDRDELYFDAFLFAKEYVERYQKIWDKEKIEGIILLHNNQIYADTLSKKSGISVKFVKIPSSNAYSVIDDLVRTVMELYRPGMLVLISAGPCGKAMVYRLSKIGIRCIDTGHCFDEPLEAL